MCDCGDPPVGACVELVRDDTEDHGGVDGGHDEGVVEQEVGHGTAGRHRPHADHRAAQHPHVEEALTA